MESCCAQTIRVGKSRPPESPPRGVAQDPPEAVTAAPEGTRFRDRPVFLLAVLIAVVAVGDYGVMLVLAHFPTVTGLRGALIDSLAMVALAFPALLLLVVRPLRQQIAWRREKERELRQTIVALERSKAEVNQLRGLLPICASCKRIRDAGGEWAQLEQYIEARSGASFTHSICPDCVRTLYPNHRAGRRPQDPDGGDV